MYDKRIACILSLALTSTLALAEEQQQEEQVDETETRALVTHEEEVANLDELLDNLGYAIDWQSAMIDADAYPDYTFRPLPGVTMQDDSTIARLSRMKSLSLLTLMEGEGSRLFVGVNEEGCLGLHLRARPKR